MSLRVGLLRPSFKAVSIFFCNLSHWLNLFVNVISLRWWCFQLQLVPTTVEKGPFKHSMSIFSTLEPQGCWGQRPSSLQTPMFQRRYVLECMPSTFTWNARISHEYCAEPRRGKTIQDPLTVHIDQAFIACLQRLDSGFHLFFHPGVKRIRKNQRGKKQ